MKKSFFFFIFLLALQSANSQAGSLDLTFAGKGWTTTSFFKGNFYEERGSQVLLQTNGTYLVVFDLNGYVIIARYLTKNNSVDNSFGTAGYSAPVQIINPKAALQSDGKIVVAGYNFNPISGNVDMAVARYTTTGSLDISFDGDGIQTTDFFGDFDGATGLAIQSDGKIVLAGSTYNTITNTTDVALARYTTTGSLDNTFGENADGKQATNILNSYNVANAVAIQSDGKIVVVGDVDNPNTASTDFGLVRYNPDGLLDNSFGENGNGKQTTDFSGSNNTPASLYISNNKLFVAGSSYNPIGIGLVAVYSLGTISSVAPVITSVSSKVNE